MQVLLVIVLSTFITAGSMTDLANKLSKRSTDI